MRRGLSLADRTGQAEVAADEPELRPCWLNATATQPGHVLAWQPGPNGTWRAVVVVTVDADDVRPRAVPEAGE